MYYPSLVFLYDNYTYPIFKECPCFPCTEGIFIRHAFAIDFWDPWAGNNVERIRRKGPISADGFLSRFNHGPELLAQPTQRNWLCLGLRKVKWSTILSVELYSQVSERVVIRRSILCPLDQGFPPTNKALSFHPYTVVFLPVHYCPHLSPLSIHFN
jgi:hypothetical protein